MPATKFSEYYQQNEKQLYWSRQTQPIAPSQILINRLECGWQLGDAVRREVHQSGSGRSIDIFHFTLTRDGEKVEIPVRSNPVIKHLIVEHHLRVIAMT